MMSRARVGWDPKSSPTGDYITDELLALADRLVTAAHNDDQLGAHTAFADAEDIVGDPLRAAQALAVLLAAMCDDEPAAELLAWRRNPTEYRRLRNHGVRPTTARVLAARVADLLTARTARPTDMGVA